MISGVDIKDWHNQSSVNGKGWEVQELTTGGWVTVSHVANTRELAQKMMKYFSSYSPPHIEFRVYEVLG